MTAWRTTWWTMAGLVAVAGAIGTPLALGKGHAVAMLVTLVLFGAMMGWAFSGEFPNLRRTIPLGIAIFTVPFMVPGLVLFLGPALWALVGALLLTSPYVVAPIGRLVAKRLRRTDIESVGLASPDEALRLQWVESTRQLHSASSDEDRLLIIELRAHILDDLVDRYGPELPDYVWTELHDSGGSGPDRAPRTS